MFEKVLNAPLNAIYQIFKKGCSRSLKNGIFYSVKFRSLVCYEIGQHCDKKCYFLSFRFVVLMLGWTKNRYFTSKLLLENALLKYDFNNINYDNFNKTFLTVAQARMLQ